MKVLIVDDQEIDRELVKRMISDYETIEEPSGTTAWRRLLEDKEITLLISDILIPDMDGRELVHLIRHNEDLCDLPVILISGGFSDGMIDFEDKVNPEKTRLLLKPLSKDELIKTIKELL